MFALKLDRVLVLPVVRDAQEGSVEVDSIFVADSLGESLLHEAGATRGQRGGVPGPGKKLPSWTWTCT